MPTLLWILLALLVVFAAAALATRPGAAMAPVEADRADVVLPEGRVQEADVRRLRFGMVLRGYRMAEVDRVLDRLAAELSDRDAELDELRGALAQGGGDARPAEDVAAPAGDAAFAAVPADEPVPADVPATSDDAGLTSESRATEVELEAPDSEPVPVADARPAVGSGDPASSFTVGAVEDRPAGEPAPALPEEPAARRTSAFDVADWSMPDVPAADSDSDATADRR